ncbi:MAG: AAA family ATPase [Promethearchaeota archaeon]
MQIKKLSVMNFKSFKELNFNFKKINIILGPNNSGKSNLFRFLLLLKQTVTSNLKAPLL